MFDRAEKIFSDLVVAGSNNEQVFLRLQEIYEQEKEWQLAIHITDRLVALGRVDQSEKIAHYHCEIAESYMYTKQWQEARTVVDQALAIDSRCLRAHFLAGDLEVESGNIEVAKQRYQEVLEINWSFAPLAYDKLFSLYSDQNNLDDLLDLLNQQGLDKDAAARFTILRIHTMRHDKDKVRQLLQAELARKNAAPNLVKHYLEFMRESSSGDAQQAFGTLHRLLDNELSNYRTFRCQNCGYDTNTLFWLCPTCRNWGTVKTNRNMNIEYGRDLQV